MKAQKPSFIKLTPEESIKIRERLAGLSPTEEDCLTMCALMDSYEAIREAYVNKRRSVHKLLKLIFGSTSERARDIFNHQDGAANNAVDPEADNAHDGEAAEQSPPKKKRKGHGRNSTANYPGAERIFVPHPSLKNGDSCPGCLAGKVYNRKEPGVLVRFKGQTPIQATVWEQEKLRCNLCGEVFTAPLPQEAGNQKYDPTAGAMICLMKYGSGIPFYRLARRQRSLGIPLPESTQFEAAETVANSVHPAFRELKRQGAQMGLHHNDDTNMRVLSLIKENKEISSSQRDKARKGIFTSSVVAVEGDRKIALFFTGRNHAGENLDNVLAGRADGHPASLQMCDALSRNLPKNTETIEGNCLDHARRAFLDVADAYPDECEHVIKTLGKVYHYDALSKDLKMSPHERLKFHQDNSGPVMDRLKKWMVDQFEEKKVEPNSNLGEAIQYMLKRWEKFTLFLRYPSAPLSNCVAEQALNIPILNRKNAMFYKTEHGAYIGDMFMSIIHTCNLNGIDPFRYLTVLQLNSSDLFKNPSLWMPWNYHERLEELSQHIAAA